MELRLEDQGRHGVFLLGPVSEHYEQWRAEAEAHQQPVPASFAGLFRVHEEDRPGSAILVNGSGRSIVAWALIWRFEELAGHQYDRTFSGGSHRFPSLLLPFGMDARQRARAGYWDAILPGSKRYLDIAAGRMIGGNGDVRPPAEEEEGAEGGCLMMGGSEWRATDWRRMRRVTLILDGLFFDDGCFAGPNQTGLWDWFRGCAQSCERAARVAERGLEPGAAPEAIYAELGLAVEWSAPPTRVFSPESVRRDAAGFMTNLLRGWWNMLGAEETLRRVAAWRQDEPPEYRRL